MSEWVERQGLEVAEVLATFVETRALPGTGLTADRFWTGFAQMIADLAPRNAALLAEREALQGQIDAWHTARRGSAPDPLAEQAFLTEIGYLVAEGADFSIDPGQVDPEIAAIAGPQLVVPVMNARFALNAANARWGSLFDALYGTDALGDLPPGGGYDAERGARVVAFARAFLDRVVPLAGVSHAGATGYRVADGELWTDQGPLADPRQFVGYDGAPDAPRLVGLKHNGLHVLLRFDADHPVGRDDPAHLADVVLEAAVTVIMDCEDSVAAVDAADKVAVYGNWLGLMNGTLAETLVKDGREITRTLALDRLMTGPRGAPITLPGRALMLLRNVGHLMGTPALIDADGAEVPEGIMDAMLTVLCAMHDGTGMVRNSAARAIYVVKPKMHGPAEVAFACEIFDRVEAVLGLPRNTVKLGIMDEERRTSANLKECIRAARDRVVFINTGFLDRTGDEIHTGMEAGPMLRKAEMKDTAWLAAYEDRNVDIGLACGFSGRAQIGKGMWAMPDRMADMLAQKVSQPRAGANCGWVPSPTAAVLHATHYHEVDVFARQAELTARLAATGPRAGLEALLTLPLAHNARWSEAEIEAEVETNAQGILGYVVRWVDQGIGCSKVPDRADVALMEDRATCRISSQALANWLLHGVVTPDQTMRALHRMALVVDRQNAGDAAYRPMGPGFEGLAFQAACDLVFRGRFLPSGYTEPVLHGRRLQVKAVVAAGT